MFVIAAVLSDVLLAGGNGIRVYEALGIIVGLNVLYHGAMELTVERSLGRQWAGLGIRSVTGGQPATCTDPSSHQAHDISGPYGFQGI